jgi:hypothetical protein
MGKVARYIPGGFLAFLFFLSTPLLVSEKRAPLCFVFVDLLEEWGVEFLLSCRRNVINRMR